LKIGLEPCNIIYKSYGELNKRLSQTILSKKVVRRVHPSHGGGGVKQ